MKFRDLKSEEIECRVQQVIATKKSTGCILLLYKDARCDMNILDEVVGADSWKREHKVVGGNLFCTVSIYSEKLKEWIGKEDVGTESMTEKEKGQASDSFKRACFNWGIGRELYSAPFTWITLKDGEYYENKNKKLALSNRTKFHISKIKIKDKKIIELEICDQDNNVRFNYGNKGNKTQTISKKTDTKKNNDKKETFPSVKDVFSDKLDNIGIDSNMRQSFYAKYANNDIIKNKLLNDNEGKKIFMSNIIEFLGKHIEDKIKDDGSLKDYYEKDIKSIINNREKSIKTIDFWKNIKGE